MKKLLSAIGRIPIKSGLLSCCLMLSYTYSQAQAIFYAEAPASVAGLYNFTWAQPINNWGTADLNDCANAVRDTLMMVDDGTNADSLGCNPLVGNLAGKIAVVYRYSCEFGVKAKNAQDAGAVGVIIINHSPGVMNMSGGAQGLNVTIPTVMISSTDGAKLRAAMDAGEDVVVFIGSKCFTNDLGFYASDILIPRATANPAAVSQNATEFNVPLGAWIHNYGTVDQTGVMVSAVISGAGTYSATSSPLATLASGDSAWFTVPTYSASSYNGLYHINYTINYNATDDFNADNKFYANFLIDSLASYAFIDTVTRMPVSTDYYRATDGGGYVTDYKTCIHFRDANASRLSAMGIYASAATNQRYGTVLDGLVLDAKLYEWNDIFTGLSDTANYKSPWTLNEVGSGFYTFSSDLQGKVVYIPFSSYITLKDNQRYLFCAGNYGSGADTLQLGFDTYYDYAESIFGAGGNDQPVSIILSDGNQYATGFGTGYTSAVSALFGHVCVDVSVTSTQTACNANTGTATATASSGTFPYTYLWSDGQTTSTASGLAAAIYTITVTDSYGCIKKATATITNISNPIVTITTNQNVSCKGLNDGAATANISGGIFPYAFSWSDGQTAQTAIGLSSGTYTVAVTDANGCTGTATKNITQPNNVLMASANVVVHASCGNAVGSASANPSGGTTPYTYLWSNNTATQQANNLFAGDYSVTITDANGCTTSANVVINNSVSSPALPICAVTVDSLSKNNVIVWDKTSYPIADTFFIYRDTANNNYALIGKVPYDSLSRFTDTVRTLYAANGDPNATTWKYKIAVKDTCGNISPKSPYHKTLFIQNNSGNFIWNDYLIEGQVAPIPALSNYLFQRDNSSNGNWITIGTLSASSLSYTDAAYSTFQNTATWRVRTVWNISCTPTIIDPKNPEAMATTINASTSNTFRTGVVSVYETLFANSVNIYPNPSNGKVHVSSSKFQVQDLEIYNVYGERIYFVSLVSRPSFLVSIDLPDGIYFAHIKTERGTVVKKMVISH